MVNSSFFADGPGNTGVETAPAAPASFYVDPAAAASSAAQAADSALAAAASAAAAVSAAASAASASIGKANIDSPSFTGVPTAPTPSNGDSSNRLATTAWVAANAVGSAPATATPIMDGTAAVGTASKYAREDHVHPTDTSRASVAYVDAQIATVAPVSYVDAQDALKAPLASPAFTGAPTAITPPNGNNTTRLATTAFVSTAVAAKAPLASPALTGTPTAPTPAAGDSSTKIATTAFVNARPGTIIDSAYAEYTANVDINVRIPTDDTIPQNTEGFEILSVSITPKSTTNKLRVRFQGSAAPAAADNIVFAAFLNSEADARAAHHSSTSANFAQMLILEHEFVPGVTTACTVRIRVGTATGVMRFNGTSSSRIFGGVNRTTLVVEEIVA